MLIKSVKKIFKSKAIFLCILFFVVLILPSIVFAQSANINQFATAAGIDTASSLPTIIGRIVQVILATLGIVAILLIIYAGFKYMSAEGDPAKVEKAKKIIISAVIGLIIIFSAFAIVTFIFSRLINPIFRPPSGPCTPGDYKYQTYSGIVDCAVSTCQADGSWSNWDYNNCYFLTKKQYSFVSGLKEESIPWEQNVSRYFNGVMSVPQSTLTQAKGYGHFKGASNIITAMTLSWSDLIRPGSSSFSPIVSIVQDIAGSQYNVVENSFAPWDTSAYPLNSTSSLQIILSPEDADHFYKILNIKFISRHCFDGIQNQGETGLDCGGDCGGCAGDSCNVDSNSTCNPSDAMCRWGVCEQNTCLCLEPPTIDYISPSFDALLDTDPHDLNTWEDDIANGAKGNYISIWGRNFGKTTGTVTFIDKNDPSKRFVAQIPGQPCSATWQEHQVVAQIPETDKFENVTSSQQLTSNTSTNYYIVISNVEGLDSNEKDFQVNLIDRPGICSATPGQYPATTTISGIKFPFAGADIKNIVWTIGSYVNGSWKNGQLANGNWLDVDVTNTPTTTSWTQNSVIDNIPEASSQNTANVRIFNGNEYSNYYLFRLGNGGLGQSCGFYNNVCAVNNGLCQSGLNCNHNTCLCEQASICTPGTVSSTCTVVGGLPNCDYVNMCKADGSGWQCSPKSDDPDCNQNPFMGIAGQSIFAWGFSVNMNGGLGGSCGLDAWGSCNPKGCGTNLDCNTGGIAGNWIELFNASTSQISLNNAGVAIVSPGANLTSVFPLLNNSKDIVGNYTATSSNIIYSSDAKFGRVALFAGEADSFIEPPKQLIRSLAVEGSISVWVNFSSNQIQHVFWAGTGGSDDDGFGGEPEVNLSINGGKIQFFIGDNQGHDTLISSSKNYSINSWHHLTVTFRSGQVAKLFVDGSLVGSASLAQLAANPLTSANYFYVGKSLKSGPDVSRIFKGKMSGLTFYNKELTSQQASNAYYSSVAIPNQNLSASSFHILQLASSSGAYLPKDDTLIAVLDSNTNIIDRVYYGQGNVAPALAPLSFGRRIDGLNSNNQATDFSIFNSPTKNNRNSAQSSIAGDNILINELFIGVDPCTCVPKGICEQGKTQTCPSLGDCLTQRVCANGQWGDCQLVDPFCTTIIPQAQQSIFSWLFNYGAGDINGNPYVFEDCDANPDCRTGRQAPSPSPWFFDHGNGVIEGYGVNNYINISTAPACVNAIIEARFSQRMFEPTLNNNHIKLYKYNSSNTPSELVSDIHIDLKDGTLLTITKDSNFEVGKKYQVALLPGIVSDANKPLVFNPKYKSDFNAEKVTKRGCVAGSVYCWNFTIRNNDVKCQEGCVGCFKDPTVMTWQGQTTTNYSLLTSQDNACIALNPWDYKWGWDVAPDSANDPIVASTKFNAYTKITNSDNCSNLITATTSAICGNRLEGADDKIDPLQTSTGLGDNMLANVTTTINAFLFDRPNVVGYCRIKNNFTDVVVQEERDCHAGRTQSPTPWNGSEDACTNALISARFNRPVVDSNVTLKNGHSVGNIIIEDCGSNMPSATSTCTEANFGSVVPSIHIFDYNHPLSQTDLFNSTSSNTNPEGFIIDVTLDKKKYKDAAKIINKGYLKSGNWYRIVLIGGDAGIRGSKLSNGNDTNLAEGHLITPSYGNGRWVYNNPSGHPELKSGDSSDVQHDYYWTFKTGNATCTVDSINVQPSNKFLQFAGKTQKYDAVPQAANCNILPRCFFDWDWWSLINTTSTHSYDPQGTHVGDGDMYASISRNKNTASICTLDDGTEDAFDFVDPVQTATAKSNGVTHIAALAPPTTTGSTLGAEGFGKLRIGKDAFDIISHYPDQCLCVNTPLKIGFNMLAKIDSVRLGGANANISIYKADAAGNIVGSQLPIYEENPTGLGTSTSTSNFIQFRAFDGDNYSLEPGGTYRVVVKGLGTTTSILSFNGRAINNLNYAHNGSATNTYSWIFTVGSDAGKCGQKIILNPCPSGIWRIEAEKQVKTLRVMVDKILTSPVGVCEITNYGLASENASIFAKLWFKIKTFVKKMVGVASASNYWCPIADTTFTSADLQKMDLGNYTRFFTTDPLVENNTLDVISYGNNDSNFRILNFINRGSWTQGGHYRVRLEYSDGMATSTATNAISIFNNQADIDNLCSINHVRAEVWPMGQQKATDNFFCYGNYCGANTANEKYDDDQSATWNRDFDFGNDNNIAGNQHLYRFWAFSKDDYRLKAFFKQFDFVHFRSATGTSVNITDRAFLPASAYPSSTYNGARWIIGGNVQGYNLYSALAVTSTSDIGPVKATGTVQIFSYSCSNPWPSFKYFPFHDTTNCTVTSTNEGLDCPNTNFSTFYCRDRGKVSVCAGGVSKGKDCQTSNDCPNSSCELYVQDDLPSIGNYNSSTNQLNVSITGRVNQNCYNLPDNFSPTVGYYSNANSENSVYLWNSTGAIYKLPIATNAFEFVSRGFFTNKGLPESFRPVMGYSFANNTYLIDNAGLVFEMAGNTWSKKINITTELQSRKFKPIGGYVSSTQVVLWDNSGSVATYNASGALNFNKSDNYWGGATKIYASVAYIAASGQHQMWDTGGNFYRMLGGSWTKTAVADIANYPQGLPAGFKPDVAYKPNYNTIIMWDGQSDYFSNDVLNGVYTRASNLFSNACVTKLKEFLFTPNKDLVNLNSFNEGVINVPGDSAQFSTTTAIFNKSNKSTYGNILAASPFYCIDYRDDGSVFQCRGTSDNNGGVGPDYNISVPVAGKYYLTITTSNYPDYTAQYSVNDGLNPPCYNTTVGAPFQNIQLYVDGKLSNTIDALASAPSNKQVNTFPEIALTQGNHTLRFSWTNDCGRWSPEPYWDSNLVIYNLSLSRVFDEAIGIRVMANDNHYSASNWYNNVFNLKGSPSAVLVDLYRGVSDGRTVYVNAANSTSSLGLVYTNVYLMSMSQNGSDEVKNIFSQMVNNWSFNYNLMDVSVAGNAGNCFSSMLPCIEDSDCGLSDYCNSNKSKIVRDTKRVEDISQMYSLVLNYYNSKRCSNDEKRLCKDDAGCYGGGKCSKYFPNLSSGSYITGKSYSVWPSWQETLGKQVGSGLAIDPVNRFYGCDQPYNSATCWDQTNKLMKAPNVSSSAYVYFAYNATGTRIYGKGEYNDGGKNWRPLWGNVNILRYNPFELPWNTLINQMTSTLSSTCGDSIRQGSENCGNCPMDAPCTGDTICKPNNLCEKKSDCGNSIKEWGEECDLGPGAWYCTDDCKLRDNFACENPSCTNVVIICGNGRIDPGEQCDPGNLPGSENDNLNGKTCSSLMPNTCGTLTCKNDCKFETSNCSAPTWTCGDWSGCLDGKQKRTCTTASACQINKPIETRSCNCEVDYAGTCQGKCGSIRNNCGDMMECGGCPNGKICQQTDATLPSYQTCLTLAVCDGPHQVDGPGNTCSCDDLSLYHIDPDTGQCVTNVCPSDLFPVKTTTLGMLNLDISTQSGSLNLPTSCFDIKSLPLRIEVTQPPGTVPNGTAIVFVSDLSDSMNEGANTQIINGREFKCSKAYNRNDWDGIGGPINTYNDCFVIFDNTLATKADCLASGSCCYYDNNEKSWFKYTEDECGLFGCNQNNGRDDCVADPETIEKVNKLALTNLQQLKSAVTSTLKLLLLSDPPVVDPVEIGLVGFNNSNTIYNLSSNYGDLAWAVSEYTASGQDYMSSAITEAKNMLAGSIMENKIIVLMGDGDFEGTNPDTAATTAKNPPNNIKIYTAAFNNDPSWMNTLSSNNGSGSCGSGFCYSGSNLLSIYSNIVDSILSFSLKNLKLEIYNYKNELYKTIPLSAGGNYPSLALTPTADFCGHNLRFQVTGITDDNKGRVSITSGDLQYCSLASNGAKPNGNVAGASEERKIGIYDKIVNIFIRPFNFLIGLFNFNK
ncbi:MAG: LamG-like jellyroll fold domain-containing protein [Candidatus Buchananbacteria bacterium]